MSEPKDVLSLMVFLETQLLMAGVTWGSIQEMSEYEIIERAAAIQLLDEQRQAEMNAAVGG